MASHDGTTISGWGAAALRGVVAELTAAARMAAALPWRGLADDALGDAGDHPVPVVLVHGLLGDRTNFVALRRHLARRGIRQFSNFAYRPRLDYPRLAMALREHVSAVCRATGVDRVDLVGHSLGGLVARYFLQTDGAPLVRRLVTLGTPYLGEANPAGELAIFAADDVLVPPPADRTQRRMRVIRACGHLGLLTDPRALDTVARHLRRPLSAVERVATLAA